MNGFVYQQKIPGRANAIYFSAFCDDLDIEYLVSYYYLVYLFIYTGTRYTAPTFLEPL